MQELKVVEKALDLSQWVFGHTQSFPKSARFSLAARIENRALDLAECLQDAAVRKERLPALQRADLALRRLVLLIRLSHRLRFLNDGSYEFAAESTTEIGRMIGGWLRSTSV